MMHGMKKWISCGIIVAVLILLFMINAQSPLMDCEISIYRIDEYWQHRQHFVLADCPIRMNHIYWEDEDPYTTMDYVVEKQDREGMYRTVYDSSRNILPVSEDILNLEEAAYSVYHEVTLQPLVDIYGEGDYRVLQLARNMTSGELMIVARQYYLLSGRHVADKDSFKDVFPIKEADLQNLELINGEANFALTEEEKEEFIDIILNMRFASVNKTYHNWLIMALSSGKISYGNNYQLRLNIPGKEECYIYNMTGKDLDGNAYQVVFMCGDTAICLDSDENILYKLDAIKQKGALR